MKIAFIVQHDWLQEHFGVRNVFISCAQILKKYGHHVDFVCFEQHVNNVLFYENFIFEEDLKSNTKKTTIGTKKDYKKLALKNNVIPNIYIQYLGEDIKDDYEAFFITNPWLLNYPLNFGKKSTVILCYDCIANSLNLVGRINDLRWGFAHNAGYQFALSKNMHFLSISQKTDKEIVDFYSPKRHSFLPPIPPFAFFDIHYDYFLKENAIILAAPFDPRKGLKRMPDILNALKNDFDTLYIFGTPRCGEKLYNEFYKKICIKNVIHYDEITSNDLVNLYKKCKVLFFPSEEEGLGLPIIEAQLCGCRVVTTNKIPMNQLICKGSYLLTGDDNIDVEKISEMLNDSSFDYKRIALEANKKFSIERIYNKLINSILI